jgi:hypothetical protein
MVRKRKPSGHRRLITSMTIASALVLSSNASLWAQPSADVTLIPPGAPAPVPEAESEVDVRGPNVATAPSSFAMWTCEGYAAAPEPSSIAEADLRMTLDGNLLDSRIFSAEYFGATHSISSEISPAEYDRTLTCQIDVYCVGSECGTASDGESAQIGADCGRSGAHNKVATCGAMLLT